MKGRQIKALYLIFFVFLYAILCGCSENDYKLRVNDKSVIITIDSKNAKELPKHFRKTNDRINAESGKVPNLNGLDSLNISGSSQFSEEGFKLVKQAIGDNMPITVIDLRQEYHAFINGMAVNIKQVNKKEEGSLTIEQLITDENSKLQSIPLGKPLSINNGKKQTVEATKVQNEEDLVKSEGMSYVRIPVVDGKKPTNEMVDYFIQFVKYMPKDVWLHFHCRQGIGRTTTFMVMFDIMKNCKVATLEDIIDRQVLLGGKNLMEDTKKIEVYAIKRSEFIEEFYKYCSENKDNYQTTWSQWFKQIHGQ